MGQLNGQMVLPLFQVERKRATLEDYRESCITWLCRYYGCNRKKITPVVERLYKEFSQCEAFDRAKVLTALDGKHQISGWSLEDAENVFGIFDGSLDYHTCWDRKWAAHNGYSKEEVAKIIEWDYRKQEPIFIGRNSDSENEISNFGRSSVIADEDERTVSVGTR